MSLRTKLINFLMRHTVKPLLRRQGADIELIRRRMGADATKVKPLPEGIERVVLETEGLSIERISTLSASGDRALLYFHGGGYVLGGSAGHRDLAVELAKAADLSVFLVDYRLAPEHPFPAAVDDALKSYQWLLDEGYAPGQIIIGGDSAGGGLAVSTLLNLKNLGLTGPAAALLLSPWLDLSLSGSSVKTNEDSDVVLSKSVLAAWAEHYLQGRDALAPLASPIYGDLVGLAPVLVHVGSTEILRSDSEDFVDRIIEHDGSAVLKVWDDLPHVFQVLSGRLPEAKASLKLLAEYCVQQLEPRS